VAKTRDSWGSGKKNRARKKIGADKKWKLTKGGGLKEKENRERAR